MVFVFLGVLLYLLLRLIIVGFSCFLGALYLYKVGFIFLGSCFYLILLLLILSLLNRRLCFVALSSYWEELVQLSLKKKEGMWHMGTIVCNKDKDKQFFSPFNYEWAGEDHALAFPLKGQSCLFF